RLLAAPFFVDPAVPVTALNCIGVVFKLALHPFEIKEPGAIGELVEHPGGDKIGDAAANRLAFRRSNGGRRVHSVTAPFFVYPSLTGPVKNGSTHGGGGLPPSPGRTAG